MFLNICNIILSVFHSIFLAKNKQTQTEIRHLQKMESSEDNNPVVLSVLENIIFRIEKNNCGLSFEELQAFRAIELFGNIVYRCQKLIAIEPNTNTNENICIEIGHIETGRVRRAISDFYDYFYTKKHISHLNYRQYHLLSDEYAQLKTVVRQLNIGSDRVVRSKEGKEFINILIETALYTFERIIPFRKKWGLPVFKEEKQDEYLVKYFADLNDKKQLHLLKLEKGS